MWMVIRILRIFDWLEWTKGLAKRIYTRHSVPVGNIFILNFTDMVKELKIGPVISALRSVRGYSTFNRHHIRDLEDRTHGQTNEYSSGHGILMFDYFSSIVYILLEMMTSSQLVKKFSAVYGTRLHSKMLTTARHKPNRQLSKTYSNSLRSTTRPFEVAPPCRLPASALYAFVSPTTHYTCGRPSHPLWSDHPTHRQRKAILVGLLMTQRNSLHPPATYSIVGPNIFGTSLPDILHLPSSNTSEGSFPRTVRDNALVNVYLKLQAFWHSTGR